MADTTDNAGQNSEPASPSDSALSIRRKSRQNVDGSSTLFAGYARVSLATGVQDTARQVAELEAAGATRVWTDEVSGLSARKPGLEDLMSHLREGDALMCVELSRLGRDTKGVLALAEELRERGVALRVLNLGLDTSTPTGLMLLTILAAVNRLEVDLIRERTKSGLAQARRDGKRLGRPPALSAAQIEEARRMVAEGRSIVGTARVLGCSERTVRRAVTSGDDS